MRRELRTVDGDRVIGAVVVTRGAGATGYTLEGAARVVLRRLAERLGSEGAAARNVMADGWSNGALYFGNLED